MKKLQFLITSLICLCFLPGISQSISPFSHSPDQLLSVFVGDTICAGDSAYVYVIPDSGRTYTWYDSSSGGNQIGTGDTLWLGALNSTVTYYAQGQLPGNVTYNVGPTSNGIGSGGNYTYGPDGLVFSVQSTVTIDTLFVYPNGAGNVVINIENSALVNLVTVTVPVTTTGKTAIPIGYTIAPGTGYRMHNVGTTTGGLFRNSGGGQFPYTSTPLNITGNINNIPNFYYKFYDWKLSAGPAPDPRVGVTITVTPLPIVNLGSDVNLCAGSQVTMTDPQGLSCVWSNGSTGPTTVLDSAGIYSVICTDSNGCTASDTIELLAVTPYIAGLDADTTVCSGTTLTICAPAGPVSYTWSNGDTSNCATFSNSGIYSLLTQDSLGCMYHDTIEVIHENAPLSAFVLDTSNCPIIRFTDQSTGFPSAWSWDFGDGATDTTQNPAHTYASNGTYTVLATASNFCGIDSATTTITIACLVGRPAPMDAALLVYPNPGNGLFHLASELNISGETTLKAWDINGRLVREQQIRSLGTPFASVLDLRGETPGIYLIRLHTEQGSWFAKVRLLE